MGDIMDCPDSRRITFDGTSRQGYLPLQGGMYDQGMFRTNKEACKRCQEEGKKKCDKTCILHSFNFWKKKE